MSNYKSRNKSRRPKGFFFQRVMLFVFIGLIVGGAVVLLAYYKFASDLPSISKLAEYKPLKVTKVYDRNGKLIGEFFIERRIPIAHEDIPPLLRNAFIAIEDQRYFRHKGVDYKGIARAFYHNLRAGEIVEGASTITMQVARSFFLNREKTFGRKIKETILAYRIERDLTKQEILSLYLNQIYLGHGAYGVGAAAEEYFGKKVDKLTLGEMAILAAIPKAPAKYDPFNNPEEAIKRRNLVIDKMLEQGMISPEEATNAKAEKLNLVERPNPTREVAPYFTEYVRQYLMKQYGYNAVYTEGLKVFTTLNSDWNIYANEALRSGVKRIDRSMGWRGPERHLEGDEFQKYLEANQNKYSRFPGEGDTVEAIVTSVPNSGNSYAIVQIGKFSARVPMSEKKFLSALNEAPYKEAKIGVKPRPYLAVGDIVEVKVSGVDKDGVPLVTLSPTPLVQGALLSMDPYTGEILAMVGGYDFDKSEFNRAIQAKRQPGSAFKPIVYTAAIDTGYHPASIINDAPVILEGRAGSWRPTNYDKKFSGPQTLAYALQRSVNTISIKLAMEIGIGTIIKYARLMGIESDIPPDLSIALGTASIGILELARAYAVIANGGYLVEPIFVFRVYDSEGRILEDRTPKIRGFSEPPQEADKYLRWLRSGGLPFWGPDGLAFRKMICEARGRKVLDSKTAYVMVSLMKNVVQAGTGTAARLTGVEVAGKTGTTNDYKDAWFIGFTTQALTAVWVGYDDGRISLRNPRIGATGGELAAPIWGRFMLKALGGHAIPTFPVPEGITLYSFDLVTGTFPGPDSQTVGTAAFMGDTHPAPYTPPPMEGQDFLSQDLQPQAPPDENNEEPPH